MKTMNEILISICFHIMQKMEKIPFSNRDIRKSKAKYDKAIGVFGIGYTHKF